MSRTKRMLEDLAEDVQHVMDDGLTFTDATIKVLIDKNIIASKTEVDTINMYKSNIEAYIW